MTNMTLSLSETKWAEHEKRWQLRLSNIRNRNNKLALERGVSSSLFDEYIKEESSSSSIRKPLKKRRLMVRTRVVNATYAQHHYLHTKKDKNTRATTTSILQNCRLVYLLNHHQVYPSPSKHQIMLMMLVCCLIV